MTEDAPAPKIVRDLKNFAYSGFLAPSKADLLHYGETIEVLLTALKQAADRFRQYEQLHLAKPDKIKAAVNAEMAAVCERAIAKADPHPMAPFCRTPDACPRVGTCYKDPACDD